MQLKVMTYNIHSCIDIGKKKSLDRIAALIKAERPDIVALNEIEAYSFRTGFINQPKRLAGLTDMDYYFGPTLRIGPVGFFGNCILSGKTLYKMRNFPLPGNREPRYCLKVRVDGPCGPVVVLATHLGLAGGERIKQLDELARIIDAHPVPLILMGDFNCNYDELGPLLKVVRDTSINLPAKMTFPSWDAAHRIDYIFTTPHFRCVEHYIVASDASDHLPVVAVLEQVEPPILTKNG